jgi:cell division protein FtsB
MADLLLKLLSFIRDPRIILIAISFFLLVLLIWKLLEKQHEFLKERLDTLLQSNEDLRKQINILREENERLRQSTTIISTVAGDLQSQPQRLQRQIAEAEKVIRQIADNAAARPDHIRQLESFLTNMLSEISRGTEEAARIQHDGLLRLDASLRRLGPNHEILRLIRDMSQALLANREQSLTALDQVSRQATALLDESKPE